MTEQDEDFRRAAEGLVDLLDEQNEKLARVEEMIGTPGGQRILRGLVQQDIRKMLQDELGQAENIKWTFEPNGDGVTITLGLMSTLLLLLNEGGAPTQEDVEAHAASYTATLMADFGRKVGVL